MTEEQATLILARYGFIGYMGPGYRTIHAVDEFMRCFPRGTGITKGRIDRQEIYQACLVYKRARSRTKNWKPC